MSDRDQKKQKQTVSGKRQQKLVGNPKEVVGDGEKGNANQEVSRLVAEVSNINFGLL